MSERQLTTGDPVDNVRSLLADPKVLKRVVSIAGGEEIARGLAAAMVSEVGMVPKLGQCTPRSLIDCVIKSATLRLPFGGVLGAAYMIPFKVKGTLTATFVLGYKGMQILARRSGEIVDMRGVSVFAGDQFEYSDVGLHTYLRHQRGGETDPAKITHVYYCVRTKHMSANDDPIWDCWTREQIEAHRKRHGKDGREDSAWATDWEPMAQKTVLRRMFNRGRIPASANDLRVVAESEATLRLMASRPAGDFSARLEAANSVGELAGVLNGDAPAETPGISVVEEYLARINEATDDAQLKAIRTDVVKDGRLAEEETIDLELVIDGRLGERAGS